MESGIRTLKDRALQDAAWANDKATSALNTVEAFGWRHRLTGNPYALSGLCLAVSAVGLWILNAWRLSGGWSDGLGYVLIIVMLVALALSWRGRSLSYKRGRLPQEGEGVLPLRPVAFVGNWMAAIGLAIAATPVVVNICSAFLHLAFGYELGDVDSDALLKERHVSQLVFGTLFVSVRVTPVENKAFQLATEIVSMGRTVGRLLRRALRLRQKRRLASRANGTQHPVDP